MISPLIHLLFQNELSPSYFPAGFSLFFSNISLKRKWFHNLIWLNVDAIAGVGFEVILWDLFWPQMAVFSYVIPWSMVLSYKLAV